jgi:hypothetical protein
VRLELAWLPMLRARLVMQQGLLAAGPEKLLEKWLELRS